MTLDESPPSLEHRVMRHAGPHGGAGEGGNVPKEPGALRQSTSVLLGTSGGGLSGGQRPLPALPDLPLGAGCGHGSQTPAGNSLLKVHRGLGRCRDRWSGGLGLLETQCPY